MRDLGKMIEFRVWKGKVHGEHGGHMETEMKELPRGKKMMGDVEKTQKPT